MRYYKSRFEMLSDLVPDKKCAEVGVRAGNYATKILEQNPKKLYLIDIWEHQTEENSDGFEYPGKINADDKEQARLFKKINRLFGDKPNVKIMKMWSHVACTQFKDGSLDFVYIDANHHEDACYKDICQWIKKVAKGGWLCGHDYVDIGYNRDGSIITSKNGVDRYLKENNITLDLLTNIKSVDEVPCPECSPSWGIQIK